VQLENTVLLKVLQLKVMDVQIAQMVIFAQEVQLSQSHVQKEHFVELELQFLLFVQTVNITNLKGNLQEVTVLIAQLDNTVQKEVRGLLIVLLECIVELEILQVLNATLEVIFQ